MAAAAGNEVALAEVTGALRRYSLVKVSGDGLSTHRLLQAVIREDLDGHAQQQWAAAATGLLRASFPEESDDVRTWADCERLLPHVLAATGHAERLGVPAALEAVSWLLDRAAGYLQGRAQLTQAKILFERALAIDQAIHEPNDPNLGAAHNNLGRVLKDMGDLNGARTHYEQALAISEAAYGPGHSAVGIARNNLGRMLQDLGDLNGAKTQLERALAISEAAYGPGHPEVGTARNNLGGVLRDLADLNGAKTQLELALAIDEAAYGPGHPAVGRDRNNLGLVLRDLGELERRQDPVRAGPSHR